MRRRLGVGRGVDKLRGAQARVLIEDPQKTLVHQVAAQELLKRHAGGIRKGHGGVAILGGQILRQAPGHPVARQQVDRAAQASQARAPFEQRVEIGRKEGQGPLPDLVAQSRARLPRHALQAPAKIQKEKIPLRRDDTPGALRLFRVDDTRRIAKLAARPRARRRLVAPQIVWFVLSYWHEDRCNILKSVRLDKWGCSTDVNTADPPVEQISKAWPLPGNGACASCACRTQSKRKFRGVCLQMPPSKIQLV